MKTLLPEKWGKSFSLASGSSLPTTIYPAPMEGVTEGVWLEAMNRFQLMPYWVMPFIRISTGVPGKSALKAKMAPFRQGQIPIIVQLMGVNQQRLKETACRLAEMDILGVDLNCACPMPKILANGAGGKCLEQPGWIRDTMGEIRQALPQEVAVSVKLRCGIHTPEEMSEILPCVAQSGVDFISLHWRTVKECYAELPLIVRTQRLKIARELLPHTPLLVSGNINTLADAQEVAALGCDGVAPARGLVKNPWLVQQLIEATRCGSEKEIKAVLAEEKLSLLQTLIEPLVMIAPKKTGKILQIVGMMYGRNSEFFLHLLQFQTGIEMFHEIQLLHIKK